MTSSSNNKTTSQQIPIGQFSKLTQLSIKALRLYDRRGLLTPARVDATTNYRYYSLDQLAQADDIRTLRSAQLPLNDILQLLTERDPNKRRAQLIAHKHALQAHLATTQQAIAQIDTLIAQQEPAMTDEISIATSQPQQIAAVAIHTSQANIATDIQNGFGTLMQGLARAQVQPSGAPMILYHSVIDEESDGDIEVAVPVASTFADADGVCCRELSGGPAAATTHRGPYEQLASTYQSLAAWVVRQGHEVVGPTREIYLNDPQTVSPDALLTRLEFPVNGTS